MAKFKSWEVISHYKKCTYIPLNNFFHKPSHMASEIMLSLKTGDINYVLKPIKKNLNVHKSTQNKRVLPPEHVCLKMYL